MINLWMWIPDICFWIVCVIEFRDHWCTSATNRCSIIRSSSDDLNLYIFFFFGKAYSLLVTHLQIFQCGKYSDKIFLRQYIYCFQTSHGLTIMHVLYWIQKNCRYILIKFRHVEKPKLTITKYLFSLYLIRTLTTLYASFFFLIHGETKFKMKWKGSKLSIDFGNLQKMKKCESYEHMWFNVLFFNPNR